MLHFLVLGHAAFHRKAETANTRSLAFCVRWHHQTNLHHIQNGRASNTPGELEVDKDSAP